MRIQTKFSGSTEIQEKQVIHFQRGLFGFEGMCRYALLDSGQPSYFFLQSLEKTEVAFIVLGTDILRAEYRPMLTAEELGRIGLTEENRDEEGICFGIITVPRDRDQLITINLQGPILIHRGTRRGEQFIVREPVWKIRHSLVEELRRDREEEADLLRRPQEIRVC